MVAAELENSIPRRVNSIASEGCRGKFSRPGPSWVNLVKFRRAADPSCNLSLSLSLSLCFSELFSFFFSSRFQRFVRPLIRRSLSLPPFSSSRGREISIWLFDRCARGEFPFPFIARDVPTPLISRTPRANIAVPSFMIRLGVQCSYIGIINERCLSYRGCYQHYSSLMPAVSTN